MFVVTRDLYLSEMAKAVYTHLREFLLQKDKNHCQRVEYLPVEVMKLTCERINGDKDLLAHGVEAYVLAEKATNGYEIDSGGLIEKRNREDFGVLVAFIPLGLRLPAEDSYDIQTFKTYDLGGVLKAHAKNLVESLPAAGQEIARLILTQPSVRRLSVDRHIKYLLALQNDDATWLEAGAYLFHLDLIPDLELAKSGLETRIDRNAICVAELSNPDRSVLLGIETLVKDYQLNPEANAIREHLVSYLRQRNVAEKGSWLPAILEDEKLRAKLTFDKWKFQDIVPPGDIEVHLAPLEDPKTGETIKGLKKEGTILVATTDPRSPLNLKWTTFPKKPENLGHYALLVVRDSSDEGDGEELTKRIVKAGRTTAKLSLKDLELEEGETCTARIVIQAKDKAGVILDTDESESFWIEGGAQVEETSKKASTIRNRSEAFLQAAIKYRKAPEIDSEGWEDAKGHRYYRIKLKTRDIYRLSLNEVLYQTEMKNLTDPVTCGAWQADLRNKAALEISDLRQVQVTVTGVLSFPCFVDARRRLFERLQDRSAADVIEVLDLRDYKNEIIDYVNSYSAVVTEIADGLKSASSDGQVNNVLNASRLFARVDTLCLKLGTTGDEGEVVLLAPTHPLRLMWVLQYQQLLHQWTQKLDGVTQDYAVEMLNRENVERITSLNIPSAVSFGQGEIFINSDNFDLYWGIMPRGDTQDIRKVVSILLRLLGYRGGGEITSVTPSQLADRIWRYLKHHPYVSTLRMNVINPGDGLLLLNAIREIQKAEDFENINYDIAFYGDLRYEVMGSAFDEMTEEVVLAEGSQADVDEALLRPNRNPLFPKLTFSKQRVKEGDWKKGRLREAHITILIDRFSTKVLARPVGSAPGSFCLHGLLAEYREDFDLKGASATWSRKIVPNQNDELSPDDCCAETMFRLDDGSLRLGSSYYDWGNSLEKVPAIQLELSDTDKQIISEVHEKSDWVFTIDRNFGIQYFDNPRGAPGVDVASYLIDYTPEFLEGIGHRLIVSTFWLTEIEGLIQDGLKKMGIPGTGFHAAQILDVLKSISGRLALKLINNPRDAREIIGLALTRLILDQDGSLAKGILVPVDSHIDVFAEHKRQIQDTDISLRRTDLLLVKARDGGLSLRLIEVKFRSGSGSLAEEYELKEAIVAKNANTQEVLEAKFGPGANIERLDEEIRSKQLSDLLQFYFDRARRHGLIAVGSPEELALQEAIRKIQQGDTVLTFERAGYIFNLHGVSKVPETFKDNTIFVIGKERIRELLQIPEDAESPSDDDQSRADTENVPEPTITAEGEEGFSSETGQEISIGSELVDLADVAEEVMSTKVETPEHKPEPKPLIEHPTEKKDLRILLGRNCDSGKNVYWDPHTSVPKKLVNQHVLIVGKSGAGKTQTASAFMWELSKAGVPSVIFDFQGEYMSATLTNAEGSTFLECTEAQVLDASDGIEVNPLEVPIDPYSGKRQNFMKVVYQIAASLSRIFGLGDIQHAILREAVSQAYALKGFNVSDKSTWGNGAPTLSLVWEILKRKEATVGGNVRNLNLRIGPLFETGVFLESADPKGFEEVFKHTTIIRLSNLATTELMVAVSRFVLQKIYADMLAKGPTNDLRVFAVVDEAHKLSYEETLTELIREARKYGVGILLASQSVKDFDPIVFSMVGTKIALQVEGDDAKIMADNIGLGSKSERDIARELIVKQPPHRGLVRSNHFEPFAQVDMLPFWQK